MADAERHIGVALQDVGELGRGGVVGVDLLERARRVEGELLHHGGKLPQHVGSAGERLHRVVAFVVGHAVGNVVRLEQIGRGAADHLACPDAYVVECDRVALLRHDAGDAGQLALFERDPGRCLRYCASRSDTRVLTVSAIDVATLTSSAPASIGDI